MAEEAKPAASSVEELYKRRLAKALDQKRTPFAAVEFEGEKYAVRQPSPSVMDKVNEEKSNLRQSALLVVECAFYCDDAGTPMGKLFKPDHIPSLMELGVKDPLVKSLNEAILSLMDVKKLEAEATKSVG